MQLWLTVFEDSAQSESAWTPPGIGWRIALSEAQTLQGCGHHIPFRTSPVFPLCAEFNLPALDTGVFYLYLLSFDPAFPVLARIAQKAPTELRCGFLFSLGLASVLCITREVDLLQRIEAMAGAKPRAAEVWTIENSRIVTIGSNSEPARIFNRDLLRLPAYDDLPLVPRATVDEFVCSIGLLVPKVAVHLPSELETCFSLVGQVAELVSEMVYVVNPVGVLPDTLAEYTREDFTDNPELIETILHQGSDRIVQINAALSYLSTQALSGAVPVLERRSLIRRYSLLGVGTGVLALTRIARSIEQAFAAGALETVLGERAVDAKPLPGLDRLPHYETGGWSEHSVNRWEGKVERRRLYPKLPYFSGRLGFRESEYSISAALQSLAAGAGPEWSLLTLTHEMVHGHVRNLLSIIFQGDPDRRPDRKEQELYERFAAHVFGRPPGNESLLDSIRVALLSYCCLTATHGSLTRVAEISRKDPASTEIRVGFYLPTQRNLRLILEGEMRNISEILVHVLDLHYFYRSSLSAYLPLIWRSWSTLPQVRGDLRQYLLRSMLAAAAKTTGTPYERFRTARLRVRDLLETIAHGPWSGTTTIEQVVQLLNTDSEVEELFYPFNASLILVDIAHHILTSNVIRGALHSGDVHLQIRQDDEAFEDWFEYDLPDGFVDAVVSAPTAFLADRLFRRLNMRESDMLERNTVGLFLACCSHVEGSQQEGI
jgi:hypothetical protein